MKTRSPVSDMFGYIARKHEHAMGLSTCDTYAPSPKLSPELRFDKSLDSTEPPFDDSLELLATFTPEQQYYIEVLSLYSDIVECMPGPEDAETDLEQTETLLNKISEKLTSFGILTDKRVEYASNDGRSPYANIALDPDNYVNKNGSVEIDPIVRKQMILNELTKFLEAGLQPGDSYKSVAKLGINGLESFGQNELVRWLLGARSLAINAKNNPKRTQELGRFSAGDIGTSALLHKILLENPGEKFAVTEISLLPEIAKEDPEYAAKLGYFPDRGIWMNRTYIVDGVKGEVRMLQTAHTGSDIDAANKVTGYNDKNTTSVQCRRKVTKINTHSDDEAIQMQVHQSTIDKYFTDGDGTIASEERMDELKDHLMPYAEETAVLQVGFAVDIILNQLSLENEKYIHGAMMKKTYDGKSVFNPQERYVLFDCLEKRQLSRSAANILHQKKLMEVSMKSFSGKQHEQRARVVLGDDFYQLHVIDRGMSLDQAALIAFEQGIRAGGCAGSGVDQSVLDKTGGIVEDTSPAEKEWLGDKKIINGFCNGCVVLSTVENPLGQHGYCKPCAKDVCGDGEKKDISQSFVSIGEESISGKAIDKIFGFNKEPKTGIEKKFNKHNKDSNEN